MVNQIKKLAVAVVRNTAAMYIAVLGMICLAGLLGIRPLMMPKTAEVAAAKKALPIYCVDRGDNKIAISFDAAWGAYRLRRNFTHCV
ncbi:MAG: hypothetical protein LUD77_05210 [Clostridiales bacterium]|nr:hypothetical protein [Clostridiales bacterium]